MTAPKDISDDDLRKMRDAIYPAQCPNQIQSDAAWELVKPNWKRSVEWLELEYKKVMLQKI